MTEKKPSAEEIFHKNSEEMSDVERLMAEIIQEKNNGAFNVPEEEPAEAESSDENAEYETFTAPAPPSRNGRKSREADIASKASGFIDDDPYNLGESEVPVRKKKTNVNEKNTGKKKSTGVKITAVVLVLCAVVVVGAILFKALSEDLPQSYPGVRTTASVDNAVSETEQTTDPADPENTLSPDLVIPTPEAEGENVKIVEPGTIILFSDTNTQTPAETESAEPAAAGETVADQGTVPQDTPASVPAEHSFAVYREDVSWTAAQQKCVQLGGHLANIASQEELSEVVALAEAQGLEKLWIGCHRENAALVWENDEAISFYKWGKGEPSGYDSGDRVTEDYILLWKFNGEWVYNDSRDDPVKDYPAMYSGQIGYVCEFGD